MQPGLCLSGSILNRPHAGHAVLLSAIQVMDLCYSAQPANGCMCLAGYSDLILKVDNQRR